MNAGPRSLRDVLRQILAIESPEATAAVLRESCEGDEELRRRLQRLLAEVELAERATPTEASDTAEDPGEASPPGDAGTTAAVPDARPEPTIAGRYDLVRRLGEGGMGTVWLARQTRPVRRNVALKLVKAGMDSRKVLARFEAERQALAMMDHPHVAKVFDGGVTEQGRPYFVMEHVQGEPLTQFCDSVRLSLADRVTLFVTVCRAVQHAHQKGILHRDLKPSNILVHLHEGNPTPKIIDFGLAKAIAQPLTGDSLFTAQGTLVGTPLYMSPEQAGSQHLDLDTRTDIYSLGVVLYELLTGTTPVERRKLQVAAQHEAFQLIRDYEPPRPSVRLSGSDELPRVAEQRRADADGLRRSLAGDLDWIVMKAIDKDRSRRYDSAGALADDLQRHLSGEPVLAAPPSRAYRIRKFARRHRVAVVVTGLVGTALVLGMAGTLLGLGWALHERDLANRSQQEALKSAQDARAAQQLSQRRADELRDVAEFQAAMLSKVKPAEAGDWLTQHVQSEIARVLAGQDLPETERDRQIADFRRHWKLLNATDTARAFIDTTILRPAVQTIGTQLSDQPLVRARLTQALADLYRQLGLFAAASPLQEEALRIRRRELGPRNLETLESALSTGILLRMRGRLEEAEPYYREVLDARREILGSDHQDTIDAIGSMAVLLDQSGQVEEAGTLYRESLERSQRVLGDHHEYTLISLSNLAYWLQTQEQPREAEQHYRLALERARASRGYDDPLTSTFRQNLAYLLQESDRMEEAESLYVGAYENRASRLGERHPDTLQSQHNLAYFYSDVGRAAEAEELYRKVIAARIDVLGRSHELTLLSMHNLSCTLQDLRRLDEAEAVCRETLDLRWAELGESHPHTCDSASVLGSILLDQGKWAEAEDHLRLWLGRFQPTLGPTHPDTLYIGYGLSRALHGQGKLREAEQRHREVLAQREQELGRDDPDTLASCLQLASILEESGRQEEAEVFARRAVEGYRPLGAIPRPTSLEATARLASILLAQKKLEEAQGLADEAWEYYQSTHDFSSPGALIAARTVGSLQRARGDAGESLPVTSSVVGRLGDDVTPNIRYEVALLRLEHGRVLQDLGQRADAEFHLVEAEGILMDTRGPDHQETRRCQALLNALRSP